MESVLGSDAYAMVHDGGDMLSRAGRSAVRLPGKLGWICWDRQILIAGCRLRGPGRGVAGCRYVVNARPRASLSRRSLARGPRTRPAGLHAKCAKAFCKYVLGRHAGGSDASWTPASAPSPPGPWASWWFVHPSAARSEISANRVHTSAFAAAGGLNFARTARVWHPPATSRPATPTANPDRVFPCGATRITGGRPRWAS